MPKLNFLNKWGMIYLLALLICYNGEGQSDLPIGEWKSFLSYKEGLWVTQSNSKIYYASSVGMFTISKQNIEDVTFYSRENGLSEVSINTLYYDKFNDQVLIAYNNSNVDFFTNDGVINLPFIHTSTSIPGSKNIHDVYFINENEGLMATDFGILGIHPRRHEFSFTAFTGQTIYSCIADASKYYVGGELGIYSINRLGTNPSDFSSWEKLSPHSIKDKCTFLKSFNGIIYFLFENTVYSLDESGNAQIVFKVKNASDEILFLNTSNEHLMIGVRSDNFKSLVYLMDTNGNITTAGENCINLVKYAVQDELGRFWWADQWDPIKMSSSAVGDCQQIRFNVPFTNLVGDIDFENETAYFSSLGITESFHPSNTRGGFYTLEGGLWTNLNENNTQIFRDKDFQSLHTLAADPRSDKLYLGSYYNGLIEYDVVTKEATHWNKDNSILQEAQGDNARTRVSYIKFDDDENLWISNYLANKPLVVKTKNDGWYAYQVTSSTTLGDIVIDQAGNKWIAVLGVGGGLLVFNENNTFDNLTDDDIRYITKNNSEITGNKVNCLVVDLDGSVWIGTDEGPVVFDCGDPFDIACRGTTRKVEVEGIPAPLLKAEDILAIEVDGANRKWFGTRNGIFVQSPDGTTQVAKYDKQNSPLIDNKVTILRYNPSSGDMYVVTDLGIQAIKTETTGSKKNFKSSVIAYPNPVRPDYSGPIAIKGLVRDANVKITDINGRLVYETKALGGQAIWDGNDYNGDQVATGVYLVFAANENISLENMAAVAKIAVVR
ncbi:MAG: hypothetical protein R2774_07150 [Saprospiraceae bacterium]